MPSHSESRVVPYTADLMFQIVADVERYPQFVPWCKALRIVKREEANGKVLLLTQTTVGFRSVSENYTSRATINSKAFTVDVIQVDGMFRKLENHWRFTPIGESCRVEFSIAFEFASKVLSAIAGGAFGLVVTRMTAAFEERAKQLSKNPL